MRNLILVFGMVSTFGFAQKNTCQHFKLPLTSSASLALADVGNNSRSDTFDIINYTIDLDLTDGQNENISAACEVKFTSLISGQNTIRLDLFGLTVDSVKYNQTATTFNHTDQSLLVDLGAVNNIADTNVVQVYYHGTPLVDGSTFGGFDFNGSYWYNLGVAFQYEPHNFGRGWFPCFDNFVERSTFKFNVTTPSSITSYANGNLISSTNPTPTTLLRVWETETDFPTYLASVAAAPYIEITKTFTSITGSQIPVVLACLPADSANLEASFVNLEASFHAFENKFGAYKWEKIGYAVTPVGAMEHPGNIAYPSNLVNGNLSGETIMAHELAHHWFGNLITCNDAKEMWINEGWAEYLSYFFLEDVYGTERYMEEIRNNHLNMLNTAHTADGGFQILAEMPINITYGRHTYNKGADVIHTMRSYAGDTQFFPMMKDLLEQYSFKDITSEQFRDHLLNYGFTNADAFFNDWIFQKGWTQFDVNTYQVTPSGTEFSVDIEFVQNLKEATNYYTKVPLTIAFYNENGGSAVYLEELGGQFTTKNFIVPFNPTMVTINDDDRISLAAFHENIWVKETGNVNYSSVDVKVNTNTLTQDSVQLFLQQNWVGPHGTYNDAQYIISPDRYWQVKSPSLSGIEMDLEFRYNGNSDQIRDFGLMQNISSTEYSEERIVLMYRENGSQSWQPYSNQEVNTGNIYNKTGRIKAVNALAGDYTFAISKWPLGQTNVDVKLEWEIFPNPSKGVIFFEGSDALSADICDTVGKVVLHLEKEDLSSPISINNLPNGSYIFTVNKQFGNKESKTFIVKK
ncbi:MAG: M1 family aminopeptidase [Flavobacteriales bacterium]